MAVLMLLGVLLHATTANEVSEATPPESIRIASVQMAVTNDMNANLLRIEKGISKAKAEGARVVVFPETALTGLSKEAIESLDWERLDQAIERIRQRARDTEMYVIFGAASRSTSDKPYNTAFVIGPDGEEVTRYHKNFPESWFQPGDHMALFSIDGIPCTLIICHDSRFPELVRVPTIAGAQICFYISYEINGREGALRKKEGYRAQSIARAVENNIWYIQSNGIGPKHGKSLSLGNSVIVDPRGTVVAKAPQLRDRMLVVDVRPGDAKRSNALEGLSGKALQEWWKAAQDQLKAWDAAHAAFAQPKSSEEGHVRLALMQSMPVKWDLESNFGTFLKQLDEAKDADIFITPECWLDGYAAADPASSPERLRTVAQDLSSSTYLQRVAEEARKRKTYICFGFTSLENGKIYNSAGLWDDAGKLIGVYHKTHLQTHDLQFAQGESLPVWQTRWGTVGIMICADRRWPETARTLRLQGARLILNPTYGMHHLTNEYWMRTKSYENQCFIAFAHPSVGLVTDPRGGLAAKRFDNPGVLLCDVDLNASTDDNHLRDRRPELYGIIADPNVRFGDKP
ncbi:MAG: carbon-nitrogen hydrolase family protein [Candidatus Hydrogenedentes bacterium]|nr:carbon-nitrogen hydrolase family protein [Candidatus Hydrogenedentota bacterium]